MLAHRSRNWGRGPADGRGWRWLAALVLSGGLALTAAPAGAVWTAAVQPDPVTRQSRCLLSSQSLIISDGYDSTPVQLVFNGASLLVVTQSELDPSFADLQLVVDRNPPIHSEKTARDMILVFDQNLPELVRQLREGRQATVYLRFWPTWPATQSFPVNFSLAGFSKAHDALNQNCQPPASSSPPSA